MEKQQVVTKEQQQDLTKRISIFRNLLEKANKDYSRYAQAPETSDKVENMKNKAKAIYYKGKLDGLKEFYCELKKRCTVNS